MLSNTGAGGSDSSSGGGAAGAVGDFESAAEAEVSLGFAFSAEVTANCARIDENAAAATVSTKNYSSATNKVNDSSSHTSKYAVSAAGVLDASSVKSRDGLGLGCLDADVKARRSQGMAGVSIASVGVVCSRDEIQGDAGGAAEILLGQDNAEIVTGGNIAINAQTASLGLCNNVNDRDTHQQSSYPRTSNQLGSLEELIRLPVITPKARQYFKKKSRKLCRKLHRSQTGDCKVSSFDFQQHHYPRTNEDDATPTVARSLPNRGHSPTKEEVKKKNQHLLEENLRLKKDFHKANHRLKTLLADKRDLLRRLRLESKTSNNLIESIQAEANDTINRARDILAEANRTKIRTELLKDEIETSQDVLLRERQDLRKQSARLKKQAASMTETHKRRKTALADQRKEMEHDINTEKQRWNQSIRLAEKKMMSSLKQLQNERVMWQVLSQEAELRCDDAKLEVHRQKSNGRTLVQMQVDKAIRKERELKTYMLELQEIHAVQLLRERKAKRAAIQSSKYW